MNATKTLTTIFRAYMFSWRTATIAELEQLTQRKSKAVDRGLNVHGFVIG
jgi:hypothetical protein